MAHPRPLAAADELPQRPDHVARTAGTWGAVFAAVALGVLADASARGRPGLAISAGAWLTAAAVVVLVRARRAAWPYLAGGVALGTLVSFRTSPVVLTLEVAGAAALFCVAASVAVVGRPTRLSVRSYAARAAVVPLSSLPDGLDRLAGPAVRATHRHGSPRSLVRLVLIVLPVGLALAALFGSADPVFHRYVRVPAPDPATWLTHLVPIAVGAIALSTLLALPGRRPTSVERAAERRLAAAWIREAEWVALLVVTDLLFAIFVVIQFAVFFGGTERVATVEGLTYAQYARGGFWQLLGAAAIAGGVLLLGWLAIDPIDPGRARARYLAGALPLIALVGVVLVSAFERMALYERAYGLTWLRVLVHVTIVDLGLVFACAVVALLRWRAAWLPTAAVAIATASVVWLHAWNLDARIAERNLADAAAGRRPLDVPTLALLSDDATPALAGGLSSLGPADRAALESELACRAAEHGAEDARLASWNMSWVRADAALDAVPLGSCSDRV
jgi:hypothetical protein